MTLEFLQKEMISAMKAHDKFRKETISSLVGAIKKVAIDEKCKDNITEELVNRVILKEKKTVQEQIDTCPADRVEILSGYNAKMIIIDEFAPHMMTEDEVRNEVYNILSEVDVQKNKGAVMKVVMPHLKGKADGKVINQIVSEIVSQM